MEADLEVGARIQIIILIYQIFSLLVAGSFLQLITD